MRAMPTGRYRVRLATTEDDLRAAQRLRLRAFVGHPACLADDLPGSERLERDDHDAICSHLLIEDTRSGALVGCFRILPLASGAEIGRSYSARYYHLSALRRFAGPMIEVGRFCVHPDVVDPAILREAWAALARIVDDRGAEMLFGCTSFTGTDVAGYQDAFAMLRARHLAPRRWLPRVKAPDVFRFARLLRRRAPDARAAMAEMPPLLRSYLLMGGWVSDHAVVDRQMNTLHVFTGVEVRSIPPGRARLLRAGGIDAGPILARPPEVTAAVTAEVTAAAGRCGRDDAPIEAAFLHG